MRISFSPQRRNGALSLSKAGDVLTINGQAFDFSALPDGAVLPAEACDTDMIVGPVQRIEGELHIVVLLPHGPEPSPQVAFPAPIVITTDGSIGVPL